MSRLFEAILNANNRAVAGDPDACLHPTEFADELPVVALTCIDPRLNKILPGALGLKEESFIWLRNAGNIITGPLSSTMRSLALACAVKGGKEIAIIGHTDCQVSKTTMMQLLERFKALGVERHLLPDNINEYFGIFGSERQNVIKACDLVRQSPLIGSKIPVHGLVVDIQTGKLEWLVNGYEVSEILSQRLVAAVKSAEDEAAVSVGRAVGALKSLTQFNIGEMKFPETKIGEAVTRAEDWVSGKIAEARTETKAEPKPPPATGVPASAFRVADKIGDFAGQLRAKFGSVPVPPKPPAKPPVPPPIRVYRDPKGRR